MKKPVSLVCVIFSGQRQVTIYCGDKGYFISEAPKVFWTNFDDLKKFLKS